MRSLAGLLLLVTAACGSRDRGAEPAWPKSAGHDQPDRWQDDGGESLDPRREEMWTVEYSKEPTPPAEIELVAPMPETPLVPPAEPPPDAAPAATVDAPPAAPEPAPAPPPG